MSASFRKSGRLREVILSPGASKRCPLPLKKGSYKCKVLVEISPGPQFGVRLREVSASGGSTIRILTPKR